MQIKTAWDIGFSDNTAIREISPPMAGLWMEASLAVRMRL
jgi:hypothetical protein